MRSSFQERLLEVFPKDINDVFKVNLIAPMLLCHLCVFR